MFGRRRYTIDNAARIAEMKNRSFSEAREQLPELRRHFFDREAEHRRDRRDR